jgi:hypothetical protein
MTKQEVIAEGQLYADTIQHNIYLLRRGDKYKCSAITHRGWRIAEIITPRCPSTITKAARFSFDKTCEHMKRFTAKGGTTSE